MGLVATKELAEDLGVSIGTIYRMVKSGQIPAIKIGNGRNLRFDLEAVKQVLAGITPVTGDSKIDVEHDPLFNIHQLAIETGIADLAAQHDQYLYHTPKKSNNG